MAQDWAGLADHPQGLVDALRAAYESGSVSFTADELVGAAKPGEVFSAHEALALLRSAGAWLSEGARKLAGDPNFPDQLPDTVPLFTWAGPTRRTMGWLLLVHGMNTRGSWQQSLAFDVGLWSGTAVPTYVHKYGHIIVGVVLPWRRRKLKRTLKDRVDKLGAKAARQNLPAAPDVIAHSFGTWMLGHVLIDQLAKGPPYELQVGRVILTGSILRPDFPWTHLQDAGLCGDVLNHFAPSDRVVPLARWTISDSGPSGTRGFDLPAAPCGDLAVINVSAPFGHSAALSDRQRAANYEKTWRPFLTNPIGQASRGLTSEASNSDPN